MMKLLTAGYGHGDPSGVWISLRCNAAPDPFLDEILQAYGCHAPALPKIRACLTASGRYDCMVQSLWIINRYGQIANELSQIGISILLDRHYYGGQVYMKWPREFQSA